MSVLVLLLIASLLVALIFLGAFLWAVRNGQFDDTFTPAWRVLSDDDETKKDGEAERNKTERKEQTTS